MAHKQQESKGQFTSSIKIAHVQLFKCHEQKKVWSDIEIHKNKNIKPFSISATWK